MHQEHHLQAYGLPRQYRPTAVVDE